MEIIDTLDDRVARVVRELEGEAASGGVDVFWAPKLHPDSARFLHLIIRIAAYRRLLEIGGGTGYSTLWLADAARHNGGTLVSCEIEPALVELSKQHVRRAGLHGVVEYLVGDARKTVAQHPGPFDFVLIDTTKSDYITYFELLTPKILPNGLIVADNVLSHAQALQGYLEHIRAHPLYASITVPVGKGLALSRRIR